MTEQRWHDLMDEPDNSKAILTPEEIKEGWHWCWDFDFLLVGPGMQEQEMCHCFEE